MSDGKSSAGEATPPPLHVFDDIEEQDNRLPNWWLGILYGTMVFAFGYWFVYEIARLRPNPGAIYRAEAAAAAQRAAAAPLSDQAIVRMAGDTTVLGDAKKLFATMCAPCHGTEGQGQVGPNLTDRHWMHGGAPTAIYKSITAGFPDKGMPAWGPMLGPARIRALSALLVSMKGKNLPGKEPQGVLEEN